MYSAFLCNRLKCAQTWITQFYLQITPCLPLFPSRRTSPPFGWYSFYRPTEGRRLSRPFPDMIHQVSVVLLVWQLSMLCKLYSVVLPIKAFTVVEIHILHMTRPEIPKLFQDMICSNMTDR